MVFPPPEWPGHLIGDERATGAEKIPLRGDAAAVVVAGTSTVRGLDGRTPTCLAEMAATESLWRPHPRPIMAVPRQTLPLRHSLHDWLYPALSSAG